MCLTIKNESFVEYAFTAAPMLTYRTIGGILDFYVFMGPSLEEIVQQYSMVSIRHLNCVFP